MSICGDTVLVFNVSELGKFHLTILEGRNLPAADSNGLSDPYVTVRAEKGLFVKDNCVKTSVRSATLNPKWNQAFELSWNHQFRKLVLRVYDHDKWSKDDFLGKARISFGDICDQQEHDMWLPLYKSQKNKETAGEIHIKILANSKIPLVVPPNFIHLEFTRREKDQDIMFEFGWDLKLKSDDPNSEGTTVTASLLGLDYRYKCVDRFSADYSGNLGTCIQYVKDKLTDDEEVGSGENFFIQLQKLSLDVKYLVACVHVPTGTKSLTCLKGAFVRATKDTKKNSGRTLAFHRVGSTFTEQGIVLAVIKRSYNGQWVFTAAAHSVSGASSADSASQVSSWAKDCITP